MMAINLSHHRLMNQRISGDKPERPEQAVRHLGAIQAQDYHQALWAVGLRTQASTAADVERSIAERKTVLTWPMRGTIHMIPAEDAGWMLKLTAPRALAKARKRFEVLSLSPGIVERAKQICYDAMNGRRPVSRPSLIQLLTDNGLDCDGPQGSHLLGHLAQTGYLCMGPREGKQQTFVLLDEWVFNARTMSMDEALAVLTERFFASHGPATVQDFAWWTGLTLADVKRGVASVQSKLETVNIDGQTYWMGDAGSTSANKIVDVGHSAYLLAGFDEYLLGYKDRSSVLRAEHAPKIVPGQNGVFMPLIVIGGQVAGTWKRTVRSKAIDIDIQLFAAQNGKEELLHQEAARYCSFMGLPLGGFAVHE